MWKIIAGFIIFAAVALYAVSKGGDKVNMQGEAGGHATEAVASTPASAPASAPSSPAK